MIRKGVSETVSAQIPRPTCSGAGATRTARTSPSSPGRWATPPPSVRPRAAWERSFDSSPRTSCRTARTTCRGSRCPLASGPASTHLHVLPSRYPMMCRRRYRANARAACQEQALTTSTPAEHARRSLAGRLEARSPTSERKISLRRTPSTQVTTGSGGMAERQVRAGRRAPMEMSPSRCRPLVRDRPAAKELADNSSLDTIQDVGRFAVCLHMGNPGPHMGRDQRSSFPEEGETAYLSPVVFWSPIAQVSGETPL